MAHPKGQPLFEMLPPRKHADGQSSMRRPNWMGPEAEAPSSPPPEKTPEPGRSRGWMKSTVDMQLPRGSLFVLVALGLILLASAFMVGRVLEQRHQRAVGDDVVQQSAVLEPLRNAPVNTALVAPLQALDPSHFPLSQEAGSDPRRQGLNYFRLFQVPSRYKTDAERVVVFLAEHKVDAVVLSIQNGDLYKVIALPGFERISDPQAQEFEKQLRLLGRMWKQQRKGSTDWQDLYPEKYLPGRN